MTNSNVPDPGRSVTTAVTSATARYSLDDRRRAVADLDSCTDLDGAAHFVLGALMEEVRANARGGARPEDTRWVLALADLYEERVRAFLGYGAVPARVAALAGDGR